MGLATIVPFVFLAFDNFILSYVETKSKCNVSVKII